MEIKHSRYYVLQIDKMQNSYRVVMFGKSGELLNFVGSVFYTELDKLGKFLDKLSMKPTKKLLVLRTNNET